LCKIFDVDIKSDYTLRPFRTASSGAVISCKGDLRSPKVPWLEPLTFEAKHLSQYTKREGAVFHLYFDLLEKINNEARDCHSTPVFTFGFKHVHTHRGEGRVQFVIPTHAFRRWIMAAGHPKWECVMDKIKYKDKDKKYYLVSHDMLWKYASDPNVITVFPIQCLFNEQWVIISRRHLEKLLIGVRETWKSSEKAVNVDPASAI
jgi:hypothetical protein